MKKLLVLVLVVVMLVSMIPFSVSAEGMYGDANDDGVVDASDALTVLKAAVGKVVLTETQQAGSDVNGDGVINAGDALLVLQYAVGRISKFPVESETELPEESDPSASEDDAIINQSIQEVFALVNKIRAEEGLSPLTYLYQYQSAADVRAKEITELFEHTRPDGTICTTALDQAGVSYRLAGENIAGGYRNAAQVVDGWMNSPGHRANILKENFTGIIVGLDYNENGMPYWVQLFIG